MTPRDDAVLEALGVAESDGRLSLLQFIAVAELQGWEPCASTLTTARSCDFSWAKICVTGNSRLSNRRTVSGRPSPRTWRFVAIRPSCRMITPEPTPRVRPSRSPIVMTTTDGCTLATRAWTPSMGGIFGAAGVVGDCNRRSQEGEARDQNGRGGERTACQPHEGSRSGELPLRGIYRRRDGWETHRGLQARLPGSRASGRVRDQAGAWSRGGRAGNA